ncbi:hypothetical protein BDR07DRAFT_778120 [Suillus spraguei]|nr:hypothetical protein BDR07DRAFT_778120 [Suillus spraguei]
MTAKRLSCAFQHFSCVFSWCLLSCLSTPHLRIGSTYLMQLSYLNLSAVDLANHCRIIWWVDFVTYTAVLSCTRIFSPMFRQSLSLQPCCAGLRLQGLTFTIKPKHLCAGDISLHALFQGQSSSLTLNVLPCFIY